MKFLFDCTANSIQQTGPSAQGSILSMEGKTSITCYWHLFMYSVDDRGESEYHVSNNLLEMQPQSSL
jgi:hypothetical protein